jgi:DNA gyrase subunit B
MPTRKIEEKKKNAYTAETITVLEGLEPVRKRPGMYIGNTSTEGLHHLVWEVVDNAIDEAMAGFCTYIEVILRKDGSVAVSDNGRGIPVERHKQTGKSALETVLTKLHAGGKFGSGVYKVSGGLHGVGVSVVNALSSFMRAEVRRDGKAYAQEYKRGEPQGAVKAVGKIPADAPLKTGTTISFLADSEIFSTTEFDRELILEHLRQQAYLTKGVQIRVIDERGDAAYAFVYSYHFEGGLVSYIRQLTHHKTKRHVPIYITATVDSTQVECAIQYTDDYDEVVLTFANNIHTTEGGMHLTGFRAALTRVLNDYAVKNNFVKESEKLLGEDMREGLTAIVAVKVPNPQFEGQTKSKLGNAEVRTAVENVVGEKLAYWLEEHPKEASNILEKVILASKARAAARAARDAVIRKGVLEGLALPGKLVDCSETDPARSELFIVEGDSAGGSAKQARNPRFQAILPIRGKILNVERARLDKVLGSQEIKNLIIALGAGVGEQFDLGKTRYHRVVIMTDADVDGAHIRTLLLTFFYRHFRMLIEKGYLYIAQPPLYRLEANSHIRYAFTDAEKEEVIGELLQEKQERKVAREANSTEKKVKSEKTKPDEAQSEQANGDSPKGINIQRYKGLGEMNPQQLWETTMDPENRMLYRVTIADAEKASDIFETLMGSEVAPRKRFIQTHAKAVKNLDV